MRTLFETSATAWFWLASLSRHRSCHPLPTPSPLMTTNSCVACHCAMLLHYFWLLLHTPDACNPRWVLGPWWPKLRSSHTSSTFEWVSPQHQSITDINWKRRLLSFSCRAVTVKVHERRMVLGRVVRVVSCAFCIFVVVLLFFGFFLSQYILSTLSTTMTTTKKK